MHLFIICVMISISSFALAIFSALVGCGRPPKPRKDILTSVWQLLRFSREYLVYQSMVSDGSAGPGIDIGAAEP